MRQEPHTQTGSKQGRPSIHSVRRFDETLDAADPDLSSIAIRVRWGTRFNETRVRLWFYTYLVFGRQRAALHYPIHKIGRWTDCRRFRDREAWSSQREGKGHGYNTTAEMLERRR